ncbi:MAG: winged helix-turn-helix transcriptional regulator [Gemmatimonadales bacterium]
MRSYGQYCGLARALDVIGDRWTLLIVRELLACGQLRYTDLQRGLPGIATNLLAARLDEMERAGLLVRETVPPPAAATVVRLTPRGEALEEVIAALGRWAGPLMEVVGDDEVRGHWYTLPLRLYLRDTAPTRPPVSVELRMDDEPILLQARDSRVTARVGTVPDPNAIVTGPPDLVMALLTRRLSIAQARSRGLSATGDLRVLQRFDRAKVSAYAAADRTNKTRKSTT